MELNQEQKEALRRLLDKQVRDMSNIVNAVYIAPAAQLRNRANEIEQEERDAPLLREVLELLKAE